MFLKLAVTFCVLTTGLAGYPNFTGDKTVPHIHEHYGIVFDCGKYDTSAIIYCYKTSEGPLGISHLHEVNRTTIGKSLTQYVDSVEDIKECLEPLVTFSTDHFIGKLDVMAETPLMVLASAGLRYESEEDSQKVMAEVTRLMKDPEFNPFNYTQTEVQVLSGEEQAVYAWVSLNYLNGFFDTIKPVNESVGVVDMGECSTQIAFIPETQTYASEYALVLGNRKFELYAHSYMDLGLSTIEQRTAEMLAAQNVQFDYCYLKNDMRFYELKNGSSDFLFGSSEPEKCLTELIHPLLEVSPDNKQLCQPEPCPVLNQYQPPLPSTPFYAIGGFTYAPLDLGILGENNELDPVKLFSHGVKYCQLTLEDAVASGVPMDYASNTCLMSLFTPTLLNAYGITHEAGLYAQIELNGSFIDWTMGALIVEVSDQLSGIHSAQKDDKANPRYG